MMFFMTKSQSIEENKTVTRPRIGVNLLLIVIQYDLATKVRKNIEMCK